MDQTRLLLAVVAAVLALLFLGVWWVRGRQRSLKKRGLVLFYALLLFASSAFLYFRSSEPIEELANPDTVSRGTMASEPSTETVRSAKPETTRPDSVVRDSVKSQVVPELPGVSKTQARDDEQVSMVQIPDVRKRSLPFHGPPDRPLPRAKRGASSHEPAEVVESAVLSAFELIELFFEAHASPVSEVAATNHEAAPRMIKFVPGTAELETQSLHYLESLAPALLTKYGAGHLEIRAQTNESLSSDALRFLLTQSRAEAVRDVLTAGGFPANRLVPIGSETAGQSKVSFVHRPN